MKETEVNENGNWWERAQASIPGGVNSPVRAFRSVGGEPPFFAKAAGSRFTDENGRERIDYCQSWGPMILGHAHPDVHAAIVEAAAEGCSFGAPSRREVLLAEAFLERVPMFDQVRFVNSGTEAVMSAVRLARGATSRDLVVKFEGCYHGHADYLLVEAGSGLATLGNPSSAGVPEDFARHTAVLPLDDEEALRAFFAERGDEVAALIVEPVPANAGLLIQADTFLPLCRELTREHGALLILDEVITGFRVGPGGAAQRFGVTPDLATYGKIIGGGLPVGAYAGKRELMKQIAPEGSVYQAGTLSGNPLAMAAGLATLEATGRDGFYEELEARTERLAGGIAERLTAAGRKARVPRIASLFWMALQPEAPRSFGAIDAAGVPHYGALHGELLERGVYLAPSAYEVGFLSAAHSDADIDITLDAFDQALAVLTQKEVAS